MAKGTAAKKTETAEETQTALATTNTPVASLTLMQSDELADVLGDTDLGVDGLEETDASDRRIAALVFNFNGVDEAGDPIPKNRFFDTVSETIRPKVRLALLTVHKSNAYTEFVEGQGTKIRCRSWDRVTGEMEDGSTRPCHNCPDKAWHHNAQTGKRSRNCADVNNVVGIDLDDGQPKVLRFKRTADRPWKDYLNKHFLGKRVVNGKRGNLPLFAVETEISLEMVKGNSGSYAKPQLERGRTFERDEILYFADQCRAAREWMDDVRAVADKAEEREGDEASETPVDTSFSPDDFKDDAPSVIDAPTSPGRF